MAAYNTKAAMYREEGKYDDARDMLHHGLRNARDSMGEDSEITMSMMHNYGALLIEMGKHDEGAPLLEEAYERRMDILGAAHTDTTQTMANLAVCYQSQGKTAAAVKLRKEIVAAHTSMGKDDTAAHEAIAQLCGLYSDTDQIEEAIKMMTQMLGFYVAKFGHGCKEHVPQTCLAAGSKVYNALIQRPQMGGDVKGGAALAAVLMAIVKADEGSASPASAPPAKLPAAPPAAPAAPPAAARASSSIGATIRNISDLLRQVELPQYVSTFEEEEMELGVMRDAMARQGRAAVDDVLKELGVQSMGHRTKIANALAA